MPRWSYLLVESLDRLNREQINKALKLFLHLLEKGIVIVTLMDGQNYDEASVGDNPTSLMMSLVVMWRAPEESKTKSDRICKAAEQGRKNLVTKPYTRTFPSWLSYDRATDQFSIVEVTFVNGVVRRFEEVGPAWPLWRRKTMTGRWFRLWPQPRAGG